jgi:hypothetical protein
VPALDHFTLNLMRALADQLEEALPNLTPDPLDEAHIVEVEPKPGVYQLYHKGSLVYIGKADKNLRKRLSDHHRKISGRLNISLADMSFTGLYIAEDWVPVAPEKLLIGRHKGSGALPWDKGGFGNNDPGVNRDETVFEAAHFDVQYPANLEFPVSGLTAGVYIVRDLIRAIKGGLPYVFRFENKAAKHPDYLSHRAAIPDDEPSADAALRAVIEALPPGWQITVLPGYVIMYKKRIDAPSARWIYHS